MLILRHPFRADSLGSTALTATATARYSPRQLLLELPCGRSDTDLRWAAGRP